MNLTKRPSIADFEQIALLIDESRNRAFQKVNQELVLLHFNIGKIVSEKINNGNWGDKTVNELSKYIINKLPTLRGFNPRGIYRMKQFFETYNINSECYRHWLKMTDQNLIKLDATAHQHDITNFQIVSPLATLFESIDNQYDKFINDIILQLTWSNHLEIFSAVKTAEAKLFYLLNSVNEKWTKMELRRQIQSADFERTMIANNCYITNQKQLPFNLFKDPYIFEFLDLPDYHTETELEKSLILNLQKFILEIGKEFTYMGNQFRLQVGNKDYFTDLLFYNREFQCLILFELKIQEFEPEFLGKLNFYLEALDRDVKRKNENPSIGILLCRGKDHEVVEYSMARNSSPAIIADYETKLIPKKILAEKLNQLVNLFSKTK